MDAPKVYRGRVHSQGRRMASVAAGRRLPLVRTSFIGRSAEITRILELLEASPIVTLTGAGGAGKTRLALEAAHRFAGDPAPWWVDLTSLRDGDLVLSAVATSIGVRRTADLEEIAATVGDERCLLLLDNCEHLVDAAAACCSDLIARCPGLVVLATSRLPLRVDGEVVVNVAPMEIDEEAVRLFADRAAAGAGFVLGPDNEDAVRAICRRLDGIPLAIELAAPWTAVMSPAELLPMLDRRFELLRGGSRSSSERQRTLRSAIDWSHQLLSAPERTLFRRLSIFAGSFSRRAAERICSDGALSEEEIVGRLAALCSASMVVAESAGSETTRYRLLESLREFGLERLREAGEEEGLRARHLDFFTEMAEQAFHRRMHGGLESVIDVLDADRDNVRAALDWGQDRDPERTLGLAATLVEDLRRTLFTFGEIRPRLMALLAAVPTGTPRHGWGLLAAGYPAFTAADDEAAIRLFRESLDTFRSLGDRCGEAWARLGLGHALWGIGRLGEAVRELRRSEALHEELGNRLGRHRARIRAGIAEALDPERQPAVRRELEEGVDESARLGDAFGAGMAHNWIGMIDLTTGQVASARSHFLAALPFLENDSVVAVSLFGLAACCVEVDPERSLKLIGAGEALQPRSGLPKPQPLGQVIEEYRPRAAARVGEGRAVRAYEQGYGMSRREALALALAPESTAAGKRASPWDPLTAREAEIAALVAGGSTNRQIAESLYLSVRTVESHVDRILTKLGFPNRARLAAWVRERETQVKDT